MAVNGASTALVGPTFAATDNFDFSAAEQAVAQFQTLTDPRARGQQVDAVASALVANATYFKQSTDKKTQALGQSILDDLKNDGVSADDPSGASYGQLMSAVGAFQQG